MRTAVLAGLAACAVAGSGCFSSTGPDVSRKFLIHVEEMVAPAEADPGETIALGFYGTIGTDLCHEFDRFVVTRSGSRYTVQVWGRHTGDTVCATAVAELNGVAYRLPPPHTGDVHVSVVRPDGTTLEKTIRIRG
jgi:hypothetical protein